MANDPILEPGSQNNAEVERLQELLRVHVNPNLRVDGDYGDATETAVRQFQARHGLPETGIVDATTWVFLADPSAAGGGMVSATALYTEAQQLYDDGHYAEAIEKYNASVAAGQSVGALTPEQHSVLLGNVASAYARLGDAANCAQWAAASIELDGTDAFKRVFQFYYYATTNQLGRMDWGALKNS